MKSYITILLLLLTCTLYSQSWRTVDAEVIPEKGIKDIVPTIYSTYQVDDSKIKAILWNAPTEDEVIQNNKAGVVLQLPLANGDMDIFSVHSYSMMEPDLAVMYPNIRTYVGISRNHPGRKVRIDYTVHGLRAVISDETGTTYIDHFQREDKAHKVVYRKGNYPKSNEFSCEFVHDKTGSTKENEQSVTKQVLGECSLRTYRLAQTTTGEYSNYHGATSSAQSGLVLSAITTTINRVNDIYEQDLTVRFILIANTDQLFYYDSATDPFNGSSASNMISANQTNTDNIITSANYDIGHIFSTGGSGLAGLGVVCTNGSKARGVTGISNPTADPFDIDYVAHEIGHQCGGNHTQNNSCNRSGASVEVGSGFTIMGYAGICAPNVINNSIALFNVENILEMSTYLDSRNCHGTIATGNSAPEAGLLEDKIIPHSTPFVLDIVTTDPDGGDIIYHTWEQNDPEVATMPPVSTNTGGPTFRGFLPVLNSERYFPNIADYANGVSPTWEVLPSVARNMSFIYTARDRDTVVGCIDTAKVILSVDGSSGPFDISSQSSSVSYTEYTNVTITWNTANTENSPINAKLVDILYSRDGGLTYVDTLVRDTKNDGERIAVVPAGLENDARFMVKPSGNYFFDINDADITITNDGASFTTSLSDYYESLCSNNSDINIGINSISQEGFTGNVTYTVTNVPTGVTATLANNVLPVGTANSLLLSDFSALDGDYVILINAESNGIQRTEEFYINVIAGSETTTLIEPINGATDVENNPILKWSQLAGNITYEYELSDNSGNIIQTGITSSSSTEITNILGINKSYTWKVRPITDCGAGIYSTSFTFSTGSCLRQAVRESLSIPATIATVTSSVNVPFSGNVTDVNILGLDIEHSWIEDLDIRLENPANTSVLLYDNTCGQDDDILLSYDDAGSAFSCNERTSGNTLTPEGSLATQNNSEINGQWDLIISDVANQDGGVLNRWTLEVCFDNNCELTVSKLKYDDGVGSLKGAIDCSNPGDVIIFDNSINNSTIILGEERILLNKNLTIQQGASQNITISGTDTTPLMEISSGANIQLIGLQLENLTSIQGVLKNEGVLTLQDVKVIAGTGKDAVISESGTINVVGETNLEEN